MSGSQHDDDDFLDDDFVVEDIAGKNDDLDRLFEEPAMPKAAPTEPAEPDSEDVLFTDHTQGLEASASFDAGRHFDEAAPSQWDGELLDLEEVGAQPDERQEPAAEQPNEEELAAFEQAFTDELDSLLHKDEEEFEFDSDTELELVDRDDGVDGASLDGDSVDGISEFEQSGPFVLDDGDGAWAEQAETAEQVQQVEEVEEVEQTDAGAADELEPVFYADVDEETPDFELQEAALGEHGELVEPGWEPLPAASVDELSEVGEVAFADDEGEAPQRRPMLAPAAPEDLEDVEGHDIYADEEPQVAEVLGGRRAARSALRLLLPLAASLLVLAGAATVVVRPQWFGLSFEPERVGRVEVQRPKIDVEVGEPALPAVDQQRGAVSDDAGAPGTDSGGSTAAGPASEGPNASDPTAGTTGEIGRQPIDPAAAGNGTGGAPTTGALTTPTTGSPTTGSPGTAASGTGTSGTGTSAPDMPATGAPTTEGGSGSPKDNGATEPVLPPPNNVATGHDAGREAGREPGGEAPSGADGATGPVSWPAGIARSQPEDGQKAAGLVRFGEDLMVGDVEPPARPVAIDGVLPGARAFAQLRNGNYFIGAVKDVDADTITLRLEKGEVTLAAAEIARLTELGSLDYDELRKATSGSVRLTNNNRLVGGILSRIADDHVVLEFRSNRVMLPKSVVGEIVQGDDEGGVRLDTTREEDDWLRALIEREVGSGRGAAIDAAPGVRSPSGTPPR